MNVVNLVEDISVGVAGGQANTEYYRAVLRRELNDFLNTAKKAKTLTSDVVEAFPMTIAGKADTYVVVNGMMYTFDLR
jgi:hypothetical protein